MPRRTTQPLAPDERKYLRALLNGAGFTPRPYSHSTGAAWNWNADPASRALLIRLADTEPWAYDALQEYVSSRLDFYDGTEAWERISREVRPWVLKVAAGAIQRPDRQTGSSPKMRRNLCILFAVRFLRGKGWTRAAAIDEVADLANREDETIISALRSVQAELKRKGLLREG